VALDAHSRVTVLGGSGFLGRALCARLHQLGLDVTSMARHAAEPGLPWRHVAVDASDHPSITGALTAAQPDIVFNLAGLADARTERELVMPMLHSHVGTTLNVLEYVASSKCRRVIIAASLEEPEPPEPAPVASSPYAAAKWAAGVYGRMYHRLYATPVVFARVFMAYGPGPQNLRKVVPYSALALLRGEAPALSSGVRPYDWIYIDDVADGLIACADAPGIEGKRVDLGTGDVVPVREVVELIADLVGSGVRPTFGTLQDRFASSVRRANVAEAQALAGWQAKVGLREGLSRTVDWLRANAR
jgi:UDP-glucose 4-epimerase